MLQFFYFGWPTSEVIHRYDLFKLYHPKRRRIISKNFFKIGS